MKINRFYHTVFTVNQTYTLVPIFLICDFFVCKDLFQSGVIQKVEEILLGIFLNIAYKVHTARLLDFE